MSAGLTIRAATPADRDLVFAFIRDLAEYEKLLDDVVATPDVVARALFAPHPRVFLRSCGMGGRAGGVCAVVLRITLRFAGGTGFISKICL